MDITQHKYYPNQSKGFTDNSNRYPEIKSKFYRVVSIVYKIE